MPFFQVSRQGQHTREVSFVGNHRPSAEESVGFPPSYPWIPPSDDSEHQSLEDSSTGAACGGLARSRERGNGIPLMGRGQGRGRQPRSQVNYRVEIESRESASAVKALYSACVRRRMDIAIGKNPLQSQYSSSPKCLSQYAISSLYESRFTSLLGYAQRRSFQACPHCSP
jgi:hypothetical protein